MKILIVDDDHDLLEALGLGLQLQWQGVDVLTATDGEAALNRFFDETPDVVLLDVGLPHLDGFEVLRRIRQVADTPVLMLTARGEELDKVRGLEIGADDYVTKPFSPLELLARIKATSKGDRPVRVITIGMGEADPRALQAISSEIRLDALVATCAEADVPCRFVRRELDLDPHVALGAAAE